MKIQTLKAKCEVKRLWHAMCSFDNVGTENKFILFSEGNPYNDTYNVALSHWIECLHNDMIEKQGLDFK